MTGTQTIDIKFKRYSYHIELNQKITVLCGDSGTGKTTLISSILRAHRSNIGVIASSAPVELIPDGVDLSKVEMLILSSKNTIICIDEGLIKVANDTIVRAVNKSNNYFILITRNQLAGLSYSPSSLKVIDTDENNLHTLQPKYETSRGGLSKPDIIICEDEASGYQFFSLFATQEGTVLTAKGKNNVYSLARSVLDQNPYKKILIIADGSAFGSCLIKEMIEHQDNPNISLYLPESFEYVLLHSPIFDQDAKVQLVLNSPMSHIDSSYVSTEQYFTAEIKDALKRLNQTYSKSKLNPCFYDLCCYKGQDCPGKVLNRSSTKQAELLRRIGKLDLSNI